MSIEISITGDTIETTVVGGSKEITILGGGDNTIINAGVEGKQGPVASPDWGYYIFNAQYNRNDTIITSGIVRDYILGINTIYRFTTTLKNANGYFLEDSFYSDFDGVNLTNLLATRGV